MEAPNSWMVYIHLQKPPNEKKTLLSTCIVLGQKFDTLGMLATRSHCWLNVDSLSHLVVTDLHILVLLIHYPPLSSDMAMEDTLFM